MGHSYNLELKKNPKLNISNKSPKPIEKSQCYKEKESCDFELTKFQDSTDYNHCIMYTAISWVIEHLNIFFFHNEVECK